MPALYVVGALAGGLVGIIGFAASYSTLEAAALRWGFGPTLAAAFPIGIDASIVAFLALDLVLIHRRTPWPLLRLSAHVMTGVTIVLNASAHGGLSFSAKTLSHAVMPVLFVIGVEAGRRLVVRAARLAAGRDTEGVPAHRWLLSPGATFKLWRRMRLWSLASYSRAVDLEKARTIYAVRLEQRYGKRWRKLAQPEELLPLTLAPYGLTIDEALMIPEQEHRAEAERQQAAKDREQQQADAELLRQTDAKRKSTAARIAAMEADTKEAEAAAQLKARAASAEVRAGADVTAAEFAATAQTEAARQAAEIEARAVETAATAAARRKEAEDDRAAAEAARAAADARAAAADVDRAAADAESAALDVRQKTAERERRAAALELAAAEDREKAADADRRAADAHRTAVDAEAAALDAEALLKLTPTERAARYVARIVLRDFAGDAERMTVEAVADTLDVAHGTASKRRAEAAELIARGYRG
ncbi:DUF2637 domain-containing protein [Streptomyces sp. NPDC059567]|uniref:DUF2637 domain-containing protein n=1 Tax=Streptomyces sp. NPDC059567 TaxID=3346867 RepID=UPI0036CEC7F5